MPGRQQALCASGPQTKHLDKNRDDTSLYHTICTPRLRIVNLKVVDQIESRLSPHQFSQLERLIYMFLGVEEMESASITSGPLCLDFKRASSVRTTVVSASKERGFWPLFVVRNSDPLVELGLAERKRQVRDGK
ncbi:hypothetical protein KC350_g82 [Hortaea werneckii]|nr:hypothetical protein KC350_g82 [Hortaea werneckii]